ncbi:Signal transduction histidine kinase [Prosthecobacter debontii]|uniref:histidine kinase n=1 Tax=Prosthecobacter debontii TaxID=48467 RepID=A0A1T4Y4F1_9BACT|nr:ATP-binding protein [Prosthecobacter debontii]SKA96191.1 Signal transduction histidine kinase [Prosthecobacter debontii]
MTLSPDTLRPETLAELEAGLHQMKTANYFLRVAVDQVPEAVMILEAETHEKSGPKVLFSNATAAALIGVEPEKGLRGMGIADLAAGDMDASVLLDALNRAVENGGAYECEAMIQNFYGQPPQRCRWRVRAVFNSLRKLLNFTLVVTPLQGNSRATMAALRSDDLDAQSEQLKQDNLAALAQGIAHDVNNLLGPVTMRLSDLLQQVQGQPALKEELQLIFGGLKRARQFTSQVVTACKAKTREKQPIDLGSIIHDTVKFAGAGSNAHLRVRLAPGLRWPIADAVKISQVLQNLILNGIQSMPQGGYMDVDAENADIGPGEDSILKPGMYVRVVVRDRGCGIPPENLERLFKETFTTKPDGNGIGLTTCKLFVHAHEGDIRVSSRLNIGTEFTIYLPAVPAKEAPGHSEKDHAPVPLKKGQGRVLIVDDEDDLRKVAQIILMRCGYEVLECDNGQDAVKIYQSLARTGTPPDVVLMDLTLRGGMNGGETAEEILRYDPEARLVVTSGSVNEDVQMTFLEKGFVAVLPKPYEAGELTQVVHRVVTMMSRA